MTSLAMWSNSSISEVSFRGGMSLGSPWPHWPCDPTSNFMRRLFQNEWVTFLYDLVGHVLHPLLTWGAVSRTNVSRFFMTFLTMRSNFCLPEALVQGQMCRGSPWPHWPCAPAPPYPAGDGLRINVSRFSMILLAMCSSSSLPCTRLLNIHQLKIQPLITRCWNSYIFVRSREKLELVSRKPEIPATFSKGLLPNKADGNIANTGFIA